MKRYIFAAFAVLMILSLFVLGAGADDSVSSTVESLVDEVASESVFESLDITQDVMNEASSEEITIEDITTDEMNSNGVVGEVFTSEKDMGDVTLEDVTAEGSIAEEGTGVDADILMGVVANSQSKTEAVIKIAELFGISISDAEGLVNGFVAFGDEYFEESDMWLTIRADIVSHPDKWTIIAILALGFLALIVFLVRGLIKNTIAQTNTRLKMTDIEEHEKEVDVKLQLLDVDSKDIRELLAGVKSLLEGESKEIKRENEELKQRLEEVRSLAERESAAIDDIKSNSETSLKVTEESSLQILQLLYIAMNRKVPIASEASRKVWYDDAVAKVKEAAGITGTEASENEKG